MRVVFRCAINLARHAARVTGVSNVDLCLRDQSHVCSAPGSLCVILPRHHVLVLTAVAQKLLPAVWPQKQLVQGEKNIRKRFSIPAIFEVLVLLEFGEEVIFAKLRNFGPTVAIKDCKE